MELPFLPTESARTASGESVGYRNRHILQHCGRDVSVVREPGVALTPVVLAAPFVCREIGAAPAPRLPGAAIAFRG